MWKPDKGKGQTTELLRNDLQAAFRGGRFFWDA